MEQRNNAVNFDCCIVDCTFGQRYLDDSERHNDRKYNHSNGPKEIYQNTFQVYVSIALGMTLHRTFEFKTIFFKTKTKNCKNACRALRSVLCILIRM